MLKKQNRISGDAIWLKYLSCNQQLNVEDLLIKLKNKIILKKLSNI